MGDAFYRIFFKSQNNFLPTYLPYFFRLLQETSSYQAYNPCKYGHPIESYMVVLFDTTIVVYPYCLILLGTITSSVKDASHKCKLKQVSFIISSQAGSADFLIIFPAI